MKIKAAVIGVLLVGILLAPARGEHMVVDDPNDTKGRADISRVRVEAGSPRRWHIRTYERWTIGKFFERGYFFVFFDMFGDKRFDHYIFVRAKRNDLAAGLWRDREDKDDRLIAGVKVRKLSGKEIAVSVPFRKMTIGENRVDYRWYARSLYSNVHCKSVCMDRAPNNTSVTELLVPDSPE